jgi:hypothetical protein
MGCGWGGTLRKPHERPWSHPTAIRTKLLLIRRFRAFGWRVVVAFASPVTPDVAGSSPVTPVQKVPASGRARHKFSFATS